MSTSEAFTWIMQPCTLATIASDPTGTSYGLGIGPDSRFHVHRRGQNTEPVVTAHESLDEALTLLPACVAAYIEHHCGQIMVDWALEVHRGRTDAGRSTHVE